MVPDISISYHNENIADEVRAAFNGTPLYCNQSLDYKESIADYRKKLGKSHCVILVICDNYLKSSECLAELLEVYNNGDFHERIFPVISKDAKVHDPIYHANCIRHLENEINGIEKSLRGLESAANLKSIYDYLDSHVDWRRDLSNIFSILAEYNYNIQKDNYQIIVDAVFKRHQQITAVHALESIKTPEKIPVERVYICNRSKQLNAFAEARPQKINAFYIHGDDMHGHEEMFDRFCNELKGAYTTGEVHRKDIRTFNIGFPYISTATFKPTLTKNFLGAFDVRQSQDDITPDEFRAVCESRQLKTLKKDGVVAIHFSISGSDWFEGLANDIEHFVNLCHAAILPDAPDFHFFFSVIYYSGLTDNQKKIKPIPSFFEAVFDKEKRNQRKEEKQRLREIKQRKQQRQIITNELKNTDIPDTNELTWVTRRDVEIWLGKIGIKQLHEREHLMSIVSKWENPQGYRMIELVPAFKKIIEQINKNYEQNHHT